MKKKLLCILFALLTTAAYSKKTKGFSPAVLKKVFRTLKKSNLKYEFKAVAGDKLYGSKSKIRRGKIFSRAMRLRIKHINSLQQKKKFDSASPVLKTLLQEEPENAYLLLLAARNAAGKKKNREALLLLKKSLFRNRRCDKAWKLLNKLTGKTPVWHPVRDAALVKRISRTGIEIRYDKSTRESRTHYAWLTYAMCRALWRFEGAYRNRFPAARWYRPSFEETLFCYRALIFSWNRTRIKHPGTKNRDLDFLLKIDNKGLLPGWILVHAYGNTILPHNAYLIKRYEKTFNSYLSKFILGKTPNGSTYKENQ